MEQNLKELYATLKMYCKLEKIYKNDEVMTREIKAHKEQIMKDIHYLNRKRKENIYG